MLTLSDFQVLLALISRPTTGLNAAEAAPVAQLQMKLRQVIQDGVKAAQEKKPESPPQA